MLTEDYQRAKRIYESTTNESFESLPKSIDGIKDSITKLPPILIQILMGEFGTRCENVLINQILKARCNKIFIYE